MKEKIEAAFKDKLSKIVFVCLLLSGLSIIFSQLSAAKGPTSASSNEPAFSADTIIPAGYVLIPIEVQNLEALSSIVGQYGVVDLFSVAINGQKSGQKVATRLKILRAPLNPNQFAVLTKESSSAELLKFSGPFFVVIQNPDAQERTNTLPPNHSKIEYFRGDLK